MDAAVMPHFRRQCCPPRAPCAGLQSRQLHVDVRAAQGGGAVVADCLPEKLIKIGAKVVSHGRYATFQMAEVAVSRQMFAYPLRFALWRYRSCGGGIPTLARAWRRRSWQSITVVRCRARPYAVG
jgi:hypothetical protein